MNKTNYNPDVLSCLANLSNDEVFTPPSLVNQMLDLLPNDIWHDKNAKFLDPVSKTGVFLREIAKRLNVNLSDQIPDPQQRINHILQNQVFGIAITELTSLLTRRSLYCSKKANGKYSIAEVFSSDKGNIIFDKIDHDWQNGSCAYCGANEEVYSRSADLETHAYQFIHTNNPKSIVNNMKFDVIIGNPPYQLSDGGFGTSAQPIYQKFVKQAIKLNPRFLTMIIPARWYSGGKGLDEFRNEMLYDKRIREIVDFPEAIDCFPGVQIKGGVCYFLWNRDYPGLVNVSTSRKGKIVSKMERKLLEEGAETFIRYNEAIQIIRKVKSFNEKSIAHQISSSKPFGLRTYVKGKTRQFNNSIKLYQNGGIGYIAKSDITTGSQMVDKFKVLVPALGSGSDSFPHPILGKPIIAEPGSACTETYIVAGSYDNLDQCNNLVSYISTKFFRFLVLLKKNTQHATSKVYEFVPSQNMTKLWTDKDLYKKYNLVDEDISFIESMIRPLGE